MEFLHKYQWRIQDFPQGGAPTPKIAIIFHIFAENCMKMKEFGPPGGGAHPWRPPLDPPMSTHFKLEKSNQPKLTFSQKYKVGNNGINVNVVFPKIYCFLDYLDLRC